MKTAIFFSMMTLLISKNAVARDWYMIMNENNKCEKHSSPAEMIEFLQAGNDPYKVDEFKEKGKLIKVRVIDIDDRTQYVYYTSKNACQKVLDARFRKSQTEVNKYR